MKVHAFSVFQHHQKYVRNFSWHMSMLKQFNQNECIKSQFKYNKEGFVHIQNRKNNKTINYAGIGLPNIQCNKTGAFYCQNINRPLQ